MKNMRFRMSALIAISSAVALFYILWFDPFSAVAVTEGAASNRSAVVVQDHFKDGAQEGVSKYITLLSISFIFVISSLSAMEVVVRSQNARASALLKGEIKSGDLVRADAAFIQRQSALLKFLIVSSILVSTSVAVHYRSTPFKLIEFRSEVVLMHLLSSFCIVLLMSCALCKLPAVPTIRAFDDDHSTLQSIYDKNKVDRFKQKEANHRKKAAKKITTSKKGVIINKNNNRERSHAVTEQGLVERMALTQSEAKK